MGKKCMSLSMKMEISIRMLAHDSMKKNSWDNAMEEILFFL